MRKQAAAADPDAYLAALTGWQRACVEKLRAAVRKTPGLQETIKWSHLVYSANGPILLIRAEETRVLFGFWRGRRLRALEPRLKPSGKYEMATITLTAGDSLSSAVARNLAREAVALNTKFGDPTLAAKRA